MSYLKPQILNITRRILSVLTKLIKTLLQLLQDFSRRNALTQKIKKL